MRKRFSSTIRIILALFLSVFMTNFAPVMTAHASNGNNGTLKVHEYGTPSGTESNDPKVCKFNFEGFGFDKNQTGYIQIDGQGQTGGSYGPYDFGPTNWNGYDSTEYFNDNDGPVIPNGQYKATLYGKSNGQINLNDEKAKSKVFKVECATKVTPTAPTKTDLCGDDNDGYTIPGTPGVVYKVGSSVKTAGFHSFDGFSVTIKAYAQAGYELQGDDDWTFWYTNNDACPIEVTPAAPTQSDVCGTQNDKYTVPSTTGVKYKVNGSDKNAGTYSGIGTVTITAHAKSGYVLTGDTTWTFNFSAAPCVTIVTPKAPTFSDVCGTHYDEYTIPSKTGVKYKVNGNPVSAGDHDGNGAVTITAHPAAANYVLDGDTEWTFNFTNQQCVEVETIPQACVANGSQNGKIQIKVTNNNDFGAWYKVYVDGNNDDTEYLAPGESHVYTFWGYGAGTYDVEVDQITVYLFIFWNVKTVHTGTVTINECPREDEEDPEDVCPDLQGNQTDPADCPVVDPGNGNPTPTNPGQVLGDSTGGHTLSTSTNVPNVLPNTGASATNPWLTVVAAAIAFLAARAITRRKLTDQI